MHFEKVTFGFFIVLALCLNVVFVVGAPNNPEHHSVWILTLALLVSFIATGLKLGDRSQVGAILLSTSLVADLLLVAARITWVLSSIEDDTVVGPNTMVTIVSLATGALVANTVSVVILVSDTIIARR